MNIDTRLIWRFVIINQDFCWFVKDGKIPSSYKSDENDEPRIPEFVEEDWNGNVNNWYDVTFYLFYNYDELLTEEMVDKL